MIWPQSFHLTKKLQDHLKLPRCQLLIDGGPARVIVQLTQIAVVGLVLSCSPKSEETRTCETSYCGGREVPIHPDDFVVQFHETSFVHLETQSDEVTVAADGRIIFRLQDHNCIPTVTNGCSLTVTSLSVNLADFTMDTPQGSVTYESVGLEVVSDDELINEGAGADLPPGDRTQTCGMASGEPFATESETHGLRLQYDMSTESLTVDGEVTLKLDYGDPACASFEATGSLTLGGERPWVQGGP